MAKESHIEAGSEACPGGSPFGPGAAPNAPILSPESIVEDLLRPGGLPAEDWESVELSKEADTGVQAGVPGTQPDAIPATATDEPAPLPTLSARPRKGSVVGVPDSRIGTLISGRYRVEKLIGRGGMGRVYLATQHPLGRAVAIKVLNPEFQKKDPQFVRRFFLEAATAARLSHPNTITVFDYGETDRKELYIAMEYLRGQTLSRALSTEGAFSSVRALSVGKQIVRALREAHSKGIIHRDLKPGNIMLLDEGDDADFAKVLDFGLVKLVNPSGEDGANSWDSITPIPGDVGELTRAGMFLGSPKYMSPEQIQGTDLDVRTDIYSVGVVLFQLLAGRPPFWGSSSVEIIYKHVNQPVPQIHELNPEADCPPELEAVVQRCLAKDRTQRYGSMSELLAALKDAGRVIIGSSTLTSTHLSAEFAAMRVSESTDASVSRRPSAPHYPIPSIRNEAALSDPAVAMGLSTPDIGVISDAHFPRARRRGVRGALFALSVFAVVVGVGYLAYEIGLRRPGAQPPVESVAVRRSTITFESLPTGATVTGAGRVLGVTPFAFELALGPDDPTRHSFVFRKDGHQDELVFGDVSTSQVKIHASLRPTPVARPAPKAMAKRPSRRVRPRQAPAPAPKTDGYKDNPY